MNTQIEVINTKALYTQFVNELKDCAAGYRGWVDCTKVRAQKMGLGHGSLLTAAKVLGLEVSRHGGSYHASRPTK